MNAAEVAQLVERRAENAEVARSELAFGTILFNAWVAER
jgi:hypothetical protein